MDYSNIDCNWYMDNRVVDQIRWYCKKASKYKKLYFSFIIADIVLSAMIPFLALFIDVWGKANYLIAFIGSVVTIISGVISTFQYQKKWIEYRTTAETMKHTQYLYLTKTEPYNRDDCFSIFVQNIESLISSENTNWAFYIQKNLHNEKEKNDE